MRLEEPDGFAHGWLDVQRFNVLPVLFQKRNQEVDSYRVRWRLDIMKIFPNIPSMTFPRTWSSVIWTWPTATPKQRTFFNWNLIVERTSVSLLLRSSACESGVGNFPAGVKYKYHDLRLGCFNRTHPWRDRDQEDGEFVWLTFRKPKTHRTSWRASLLASCFCWVCDSYVGELK